MRSEYLVNEKGERVDSSGNRIYRRKPRPQTKTALQRRKEKIAELSLPADSALSQQQIDDKMRILLEDKIRTTANPVALRNATRALKKLEIESQRRQEKETAAAFEQRKRELLDQTKKEFPPLTSSPPDAESIKYFETVSARYSDALQSLPRTAEYELARNYLRNLCEILMYSIKHARHAKETADHQRRMNERAALNRAFALAEIDHNAANKENVPIPAPAVAESAPVPAEHYFHPIDPPVPLPTGLAGDTSHITLSAPKISAGQKHVARYEDLFRDEFLKKET